jgi:molybdopterin molybdotransferase
MISVDEARDRILRDLRATPPETVALAEAWGRVTAAPILARRTQPPQNVSAMDGYALRAADGALGAKLKVIGTAPAGHPFDGTIGPGETVRIFTGCVVPAGADTILLQEDTQRTGDTITVTEAVQPDRHIRVAGLDFADGDEVIPRARRLTVRDIGLAAAANHPWLDVHRAPRIAILATGDEISMPGEPIGPGGIVSSNSHALAALVRAQGAIPIILPIARDEPAAIARAGEQARGADLLVTTGGVSVGDHDLVRDVLGGEGMKLDFWQIAMRPGKPLLSGRLGDIPVIGLPGNPVSTVVCGAIFIIPALRRLSGLPADPPATETALLGAPVKPNDKRLEYMRATLSTDAEGRTIATPFPLQDSSMTRVLAQADALVIRPAFNPAMAQGDQVAFIRLGALGL